MLLPHYGEDRLLALVILTLEANLQIGYRIISKRDEKLASTVEAEILGDVRVCTIKVNQVGKEVFTSNDRPGGITGLSDAFDIRPYIHLKSIRDLNDEDVDITITKTEVTVLHAAT